MKKFINKINEKAIITAVGMALLFLFLLTLSYLDFPGFGKLQAGRTKNALAVLVAGEVAQQLTGKDEVEINLEVVKLGPYPNARVTGTASAQTVKTYCPLLLTSASYTASFEENGDKVGEVSPLINPQGECFF